MADWEPDPESYSDLDAKFDGWREKAEHDFDLDMGYEYLAEQVREAIEGRAAESARAYLGTYGDAVTARVREAIAEAEDLLAASHPGPATLLAATAVELTVRDLVIRPVVHGAFLSEQWAAILANQIIRDAPGEGRRLLPTIAEALDIDLGEIRLADGAAAWGVFTGQVTPARNGFVHRADPVAPDLAARAIACAKALLTGLVEPLAARIEMAWPANPWHSAHRVSGWDLGEYEPKSPFD